jgi:hypothetical protein
LFFNCLHPWFYQRDYSCKVPRLHVPGLGDCPWKGKTIQHINIPWPLMYQILGK